MKHFPVFLSVEDRPVIVSGGGDAALAKLRLLLKTEAAVAVFAAGPAPEIVDWAARGRVTLSARPMAAGDAAGAVLVYAANEDPAEDRRVARLARTDGALVNIVDNLADSQFLTPAIVDRDPVTVAIGTEGAAPVLARAIKADLEARLPRSLGPLARIGKTFRDRAAALAPGAARRRFWSDFYFNFGPKLFDKKSLSMNSSDLEPLLADHMRRRPATGHVAFVGAGPGDPELLTLKARNALHEADIVIHDRLVTPDILDLARREATLIDVGKKGFGAATPQETINGLLVAHARDGARVVRLKSGDPAVFGRLDDEIEACLSHGIGHSIVPGITAASAAVAGIGQSLTRRGRNSSVRFLTGHDMKGFAEHDWRALARPGEVAAIYMGKSTARFIQCRLLMHGAAPETPVTFVENASRGDQRVLATTLADMARDLGRARLSGPALTFIGLAPRAAVTGAQIPISALATMEA